MSRPSGLGRGLSSLIPTEATAVTAATEDDGTGLHEIPIADVTPNQYQPRTQFDEEELVSLTASIREIGVLQPILVRKTENGYELIAGERRWRAAKRAGLDRIPAVVRDVEDQGALEQAIVENLHRSDLNAIEEAYAYQQLIDDFELTQDQVATRVGKSRSAVANTLRLFQLPASVQRMVMARELSAGHGRAILAATPADQESLAIRVRDEGLSVRRLEAMLRDETEEPADNSTTDEDTADAPDAEGPAPIGATRPAAVLELEAILEDRLETRVQVRLGSRGRIVIDFADIDDLERIARAMLEPPSS